jgi:hypothetical protein
MLREKEEYHRKHQQISVLRYSRIDRVEQTSVIGGPVAVSHQGDTFRKPEHDHKTRARDDVN